MPLAPETESVGVVFAENALGRKLLEKTLMLRKIEGRRRRGRQRVRWLDGLSDSTDGHEFD